MAEETHERQCAHGRMVHPPDATVVVRIKPGTLVYSVCILLDSERTL